MTTPYLGEIRMFAGNFAPRGNATCSGQLLNVSQNAALFSLLGTFYGGNGTTTFALPDLRGRLPLGFGQGTGLSAYNIGQQVGSETVTITSQTMPQHNHLPSTSTVNASGYSPSNSFAAAEVNPPWTGFFVPSAQTTGSPIPFATTALGMTGGSAAHENRMPSLAITYIVALSGVFPSRN